MLYLKSIKKRKDNQMNLEAKIMNPKLGLLELSRQLGCVTQRVKSLAIPETVFTVSKSFMRKAANLHFVILSA